MKALKNHYKVLAALVFTTLFMSVSSVKVNEEVELDQYMNARYSADFTKNADNLRAVLPKGTRAVVKEVKKFSSGNSGIFIQVEDGALKDQKVWVYFNPKQPSLKLYNASDRPVTNPRNATGAATTRDVPVIRDPAAQPAPVVAPPASVSSTPPAVAPPPANNGATLPGLIDAANRGVTTMTPDGTAGCAICTAAAAANAPVSTVVSTTAQAAGVEHYFDGYDSLITDAASLTPEKLKAKRLQALRAHLTNYATFCDRYNPSANYMGKDGVKWHSMASFLVSQDTILGGPNAGDALLVQYMNQASLQFSNLGGTEAACSQLKSEYEKFMGLSEAQIKAYLNLAPEVRHAYITGIAN